MIWFARISGYVVGLLDVPMAFLIQAGSLASASDARAAAMFNVGVLLFLIMLAALALRAGQIWLTAGVSVLCQISLQRLADDSLGGIIASVLLLGAGAGVCTFALKRRVELVRLYLSNARYVNLIAGAVMGFLAAFAGPIIAAWLGASAPAQAAFVMLLFTLGLMAKPMLVTLPIIMLLLDYWPLGRCRGDMRQTGMSALLNILLIVFPEW